MTELFLKEKEGGAWHRVYFDSSGSGFRLYRENPYFSQSESYTLDVTLPADIAENRAVLHNVQRMDCSKRPQTWLFSMKVDNVQVMQGTAVLVQATQEAAKVQLLGGSSEWNYDAQQLYIDELDLGTKELSNIQPEGYDNYNDMGVRFVCLQGYDETAAEVVNQKVSFMKADGQGTVRTPLTSHLEGGAPQPALLDVVAAAVRQTGYSLGNFFPWQDPWKHLYVASVKITWYLAHALPHWTVKELLDEVCRLFNCTLKVDSVTRTVNIESNVVFYGSAKNVQLEVLDEYTSEIDGENGRQQEPLANANISYDMSASPAHDYDCIPEAVRNSVPRLTYGSHSEMQRAWQQMETERRRKYIFECPQGKFADWRETEDGPSQLVAVDMLAPLVRDSGNGDATGLKIVPVAITEDAKGKYVEDVKGTVRVYDISFRSISMENPTGNEYPSEETEAGPDVQDLIMGQAEAEQAAQKEDRMQLFLLEDVMQPAVAKLEYPDDETEYRTFWAFMPMTDSGYKVKSQGEQHRSWSMALAASDAASYIGQLHQGTFSFNTKVRHTFRFIADGMPDPRNIFLVRGKRYACEKIEATVNAEGLDHLMTGYFYELIQ